MVMTFMFMITVVMNMGRNFDCVRMLRIRIFGVRLGMVVDMRMRV